MGSFKGADEQQVCTGERISVVSRVGGQVSYAFCFSNIIIAIGPKRIKELSLGGPVTGREGR